MEIAALAHQKLIVEVGAEPAEGSAHGGLRHGHPSAGVGQVALFEQSMKEKQQIGIDIASGLAQCYLLGTFDILTLCD
ncbi:hypothetical protein AB0F17_01115 [Nonomuraea sp. NPDC026600]|uniref:hypothetical protein n=1 Tax=Nonomuraea sp. NPDC026600 TaxID=3155363 RepID=UPI0033D87467